jgi:hypothetical protein
LAPVKCAITRINATRIAEGEDMAGKSIKNKDKYEALKS